MFKVVKLNIYVYGLYTCKDVDNYGWPLAKALPSAASDISIIVIKWYFLTGLCLS